MPRLGGLAFIPVIFFSVVLILGINIQWESDVFIAHLQNNPQICQGSAVSLFGWEQTLV